MNYNSILLCDAYKISHREMYPEGTQQIWSNWTPRYNYDKTKDPVIFFGLQYLVKEYLITQFKHNFFERELSDVVHEYRSFIQATLYVAQPRTDHIEALWRLGYLPLDIYALPEGTAAPVNVPSMVFTNTLPEFFWLPNYLETLISTILWKPSTSATMARKYRKLFLKYAKLAGETDLSYVDYQGHDFSYRGMSGVEDAILSGMGHLLSFNGTDTLTAILAAKKYYNANFGIGGSVPASEHSVVMAAGNGNEFDTFKRLITEVYPTGILSLVSDTWDLWAVLTDFMPHLKDAILARDGVVVIRPDSGDPVKIICGDSELLGVSGAKYGMKTHPAYYGVMALLGAIFPVSKNPYGYDVLTKVAAIYGDSITLDRADRILGGLLNKSFSPRNMVFGIGSFTYEYVTRDTHGHAIKATAVRDKNGVIQAIFKDPVTDTSGKKSARGIPTVQPCSEHGLKLVETLDPRDLDYCAYQKVFSNGELLVEQTFDEIRKRVRADD